MMPVLAVDADMAGLVAVAVVSVIALLTGWFILRAIFRAVTRLFGKREASSRAIEWSEPAREERTIRTRVVGVTRSNRSGVGRQEHVADCNEGHQLTLKREPNNRADSNAVAVLRSGGQKLGYIPREVAAELAPMIDNGWAYGCTVEAVVGGGDNENLGLRIIIELVHYGRD